MRLLFVHADHLEFETTTEAGEGVGETASVPMAGRMEDCVTAFVSVESGDEADLGAAVENAADELRDVTDRLNTRKVVLYPYDHLSDALAGPESATTVLRDLETALEDDFEVLRAPVGWYKAFEIACKGHPFSELSRHVTSERQGDGARADDRAPSEWKVLFPDGEALDLHDVKDADRVSTAMQALIEAEVEGKTATEVKERTATEIEQPPHVDLLREQRLADYDECGDGGKLRWYPRGKQLRDSLMAYVTDLAIEYGAMPVETSAANDLGVSIMRDVDLTERELPLRLYEQSVSSSSSSSLSSPSSSSSFQREQRGEAMGLGHWQTVTMPEVHTTTRDLEQAREEFRAQAKLSLRTGADLGLDYQPVIRVTPEFDSDDETWVEKLVEDLDRPVLLEMLPERRHDWAAAVEFATIDQLGRPLENSTVRIDVESAERFSVECDDGEERHHPPIVHCSPSGSIERAVAALVETAAKRDAPRLPTWLSPTQVRFVPVGEEHVEYCDALVADLEAAGVRADVDDRDETVGERITEAEADWVPYYAVVGDRERESEADALKVNVRAEGEERELTLAELRETVLDDVGDLPKTRRYLLKRVSEHPDFSGR